MSNPTSNTTSIKTDSIRQWDPVVKRYVELRGSVTGLPPETLDTLEKIANSIANDPNYATYMAGQLALKAPLANPTFTGTVSGVTKAMVGLGSVDNTADLAKPISTATQTALDAKYSISSANNTACAWTTGVANSGYHYIHAGPNALVILSDDNQVLANVGLISGQQIHDGSFNVFTKLAVGGDLLVGDNINVLTTLNAKANSADVYTISQTDTLLYAKQATIALASPLFWTLNMSIPNEIGCDSYSTSQANTLLNAKQNTLTAAGSGGDIPMLTGSTIKALAPGSGVSLSDNATTKVVTLSFDRSIVLTSSQLTKRTMEMEV